MKSNLRYSAANEIKNATYDANGSPTLLAGNSYKWDGENRLVKFDDSTKNTISSFTYDGVGRLIRVIDVQEGKVIADHSYLWCGIVRCDAHDNTKTGSPISSQYFEQGTLIAAQAYYYIKDELGSVTAPVNSSGNIVSQYSYDPYGNQTAVSGSLEFDVGYAGYFHQSLGGLDFALFRAYDPAHRGISRVDVD